MGAKAWFIACSDGDPKTVLAHRPAIDRGASRALAERLFPGCALDEEDDSALDLLNPEDGKLFVGHYGALQIVAHSELGGDYPSRAARKWFVPQLGRTAYLHATHSVVDWLAFGLWRDGKLIRALSVSPDDGVIEQIGDPLDFERPFWEGSKPADPDGGDDSYPLPFHPLELSEESMLQHMGYQFEGRPSEWVCDPSEIPISAFSIRAAQKGGGLLGGLKSLFSSRPDMRSNDGDE